MTGLEEIRINGCIMNKIFDIHLSTKLSKNSIISIVNALYDGTQNATPPMGTSKYKVSFSSTAINNNFTTEEWNNLIQNKTQYWDFVTDTTLTY